MESERTIYVSCSLTAGERSRPSSSSSNKMLFMTTCFNLNKLSISQLSSSLSTNKVFLYPFSVPPQGPQDVLDPDDVSRGSDPGADGSSQLRHGRKPPSESFLLQVDHLTLKPKDPRRARKSLPLPPLSTFCVNTLCAIHKVIFYHRKCASTLHI